MSVLTANPDLILLPRIRALRLEIQTTWARPTIIPGPIIANVLRGALGVTLRKLVCPQEWLDHPCPPCSLYASCAYGQVFAPTPPADATQLRLQQDLPRPFVIEPPGLDPDERVSSQGLVFRLVLFGTACDSLPYLIATLDRLGHDGMGPQRVPFTIERITACHPAGDEVLYTAGSTSVTLPKRRITTEDLVHARAAPNSPPLRKGGPGGSGEASLSRDRHPTETDNALSPDPLRLPLAKGESPAPLTRLLDDAQSPAGAEGEARAGLGRGGLASHGDVPAALATGDTDDYATQRPTPPPPLAGGGPARESGSRLDARSIRDATDSTTRPRVTLHFLTPLLLKSGSGIDAQGRRIAAQEVRERPPFGVIIRRLRDRLSALSLFFSDEPWQHPDFASLGTLADRVQLIEDRTVWLTRNRRSTRTGAQHEISGLIGQATYEFPDPPTCDTLLPLLRLGELLHVGKNAPWGNGGMRVKIEGGKR